MSARRAIVLLMLAASVPLSAQEVTAVPAPAPVGYWSLTTDGYDPTTERSLQVAVIARFFADGRFLAVMKTHDGSGETGSSAPFRGRWELRQAFGRVVLCTTRTEVAGVVCNYTVIEEGLVYGNRPLVAHTAEQVAAIAPELVEE